MIIMISKIINYLKKKKEKNKAKKMIRIVLKNNDNKRFIKLSKFYMKMDSIYSVDLILFTEFATFLSKGFIINADVEKKVLNTIINVIDKYDPKSKDNISYLSKQSADNILYNAKRIANCLINLEKELKKEEKDK